MLHKGTTTSYDSLPNLIGLYLKAYFLKSIDHRRAGELVILLRRINIFGYGVTHPN